MPIDPASLLPAGLDPLVAVGLVVLSFLTSLLTATFSLGGGTLMLAVLTVVFPPAVVIPLHGCVQLGSNAGRAAVQHRHVLWSVVLWLTLGALFGIAVGAQLVAVLPDRFFQLAIALFILVTTWLPQPRFMITNPVALTLLGGAISALGMVVGAVGPLIAALVRGANDRHELVATQAAVLTLQNALKVFAFTLLGFAFAAYLPLIAAMLLSGFVGTLLGSRLLACVPEPAFRFGFRIILTLLAVDLLRAGLLP